MGSRLRNIGEWHTTYDIVKNFLDMIPSIKDSTIRGVYYQLFRLFAYVTIEVHASGIMACGALTPFHFTTIQSLKEELYESLAPHALKLSEAIPFDDNLLSSAIAHSNEKPYENLYEWSKQYGTLNRHRLTHPAVKQQLIPYMKQQEKKLTQQQRDCRDKL